MACSGFLGGQKHDFVILSHFFSPPLLNLYIQAEEEFQCAVKNM